MTPPDITSRARGALLGLATGNALGVPTEYYHTAEAIAAAFPEGLHDIIRQDTAQSPYDDDLALTVLLAEELLEPEVDLRRLAQRWVEWAEQDGRGIGLWTRTALRHIRQHDSPPGSSGGQAGKVKIVCFDEKDETLDGVASGDIFGTVVQQPFEFGKQSMTKMAKYIGGDKEALAGGKLIIPTRSLKKDDIAAFKADLAKILGK